MAISPATKYPTKTTAASIAYPLGSAQAVTTSGDGTGTSRTVDLLNDIFGMQQSLLSDAGITASNTSDSVSNPQYLEAIKKTKQVDNIADLRLITGQFDREMRYVVGWSSLSVNAGVGGGWFRWKSTSTDTDDSGMIISAGGTGRWLRVYSDYISLEWYGIESETGSSRITQIQAADAFAVANGGLPLVVPNGTFWLDSNPTIASPLVFTPNAILAWTGFAMSFANPIITDLEKHFICDKGSDAILKKVPAIYCEWFGAIGDGDSANASANNTAIQFALDSSANSNIPARLGSGEFEVSSALYVTDGAELFGSGKTSTVINSNGVSTTLFSFGGSAGGVVVEYGVIDGIGFSNFINSISPDNTPLNGRISNCSFTDCDIPILLSAAVASTEPGLFRVCDIVAKHSGEMVGAYGAIGVYEIDDNRRQVDLKNIVIENGSVTTSIGVHVWSSRVHAENIVCKNTYLAFSHNALSTVTIERLIGGVDVTTLINNGVTSYTLAEVEYYTNTSAIIYAGLGTTEPADIGMVYDDSNTLKISDGV